MSGVGKVFEYRGHRFRLSSSELRALKKDETVILVGPYILKVASWGGEIVDQHISTPTRFYELPTITPSGE